MALCDPYAFYEGSAASSCKPEDPVFRRRIHGDLGRLGMALYFRDGAAKKDAVSVVGSSYAAVFIAVVRQLTFMA